MRDNILEMLGASVKAARRRKGLTQTQLAERLGREQGRVSELETDLARGRLGKDRLTLLVEICDALDMIPVLLPRAQARAMNAAMLTPDVGRFAVQGSVMSQTSVAPRSTFDEMFVDLSQDEEDQADG